MKSFSLTWLLRAAVPAAVAVFALVGAGPSAAETVACGTTVTADTTLKADLIGCPGDGLTVENGVTLDLNGHIISGSGSGVGVHGGIVENGTIRGFDIGIEGPTGVRNMTVHGNRVGIVITRPRSGPRIRVENSTAIRNDDAGIEINAGTRNVDVADNRVLFNGGDGIRALSEADGGTYTNNLIKGNGGDGLNIRRAFSTVVGNTARDNGADGIHMSDDAVSGLGYFIASNLAVGNGGLGIWSWIFCGNPAFCIPPVMTDGGNNAASRNGDPAQCVNVVCSPNRGLARKSPPSEVSSLLHPSLSQP